jgi:hypothetical protein
VTLARALSVTLHVGDLDAMPARVEADDAETVTLVVAVRPDPRLARLRAPRGTLEYTTPTGVHRITGAMAPDPAHPEILRLRRDDQGHTIQRRDAVRVDAVLPVTLTLLDEEERTAPTTTLNLSTRGVLLREPFRLDLGQVVALVLELDPAGAPLELLGRVARRAERGETGVGIERIGRADETRLVRYITERQRVAMRIRRAR